MSITFEVSEVEVGATRFASRDPFTAISTTLGECAIGTGDNGEGGIVEVVRPHRSRDSYAFIDVPEGLLGDVVHPFVAAATRAFQHHLPLRLASDHIWALVIQGLALHIHQDPEHFRSIFVSHPGKIRLTVANHRLLDPDPTPHWRHLLEQFGAELERHVDEDLLALIGAEFSTTGPLERAVFRAGLMNLLKDFIEYGWDTLCGIPRITLEGEVADWRVLRERVDALDRFGMKWWRKALTRVCDEFVQAARGEPDQAFWRSMVKRHSGSGDDVWTGWILRFFPYLHVEGQLVRNPHLRRKWEEMVTPGVTAEEFGGAMSSTPGDWNRLGRVHKMEILTGFVGTCQDQDSGEVRPALGWAVRFDAFRQG